MRNVSDNRSILYFSCRIFSMFCHPLVHSIVNSSLFHYLLYTYILHTQCITILYSIYCIFNLKICFILILQNILEKFNPGARQLINAGKAYLKALHGEYNFPFSSQFSFLLFIQNLKASFSPSNSNIKGTLANIYEHYFFQFYYRKFLMNIVFESKTS